MIDPTILLIAGAATVGGAVASHLPGIASWAAGKLSAGKAAAQSLETKAGSAVGAIEQAFVHPIATAQHIDHAAALKAIELATNAITYLGDHTNLLAQKAAIDAVIAAKDKGLADAQAKIEAVLAKP
jgi:hypothetical protein